MSVRKPHTLEIRAAHPYLKKVECPPPPRDQARLNRYHSMEHERL